MSRRKSLKVWQKTRLQNLVRHKSGRYYARAFGDGKEVWKSLKTSHFSIAEAKLAEFLKTHREKRSHRTEANSAKMSFREAMEIHQRNLTANLEIKQRTRDYWNEVMAALLKSWPGLANMALRRISVDDCKRWATAYKKEASPSRYNNTLAVLRHICAVGIEEGVIYSNPAAIPKRTRVRQKELMLPDREQFRSFIAEMRAAGGRDSQNCADLASGLAFTGCRTRLEQDCRTRTSTLSPAACMLGDTPDKYVTKEAYQNYLANNPNNESRFIYPIAEGDWIDSENAEAVAISGEVRLRDMVLPLPYGNNQAMARLLDSSPEMRPHGKSRIKAS